MGDPGVRLRLVTLQFTRTTAGIAIEEIQHLPLQGSERPFDEGIVRGVMGSALHDDRVDAKLASVDGPVPRCRPVVRRRQKQTSGGAGSRLQR